MSTKQSKQLGAFIKRHRTAAGLSQEALGAEVGLPGSTIFRLEGGEFKAPSPEKLQRLAAALNVGVEDLFALAGYTTPTDLPEFQVYLRTKYAGELPAKARKELEDYYKMLRDKYGGGEEGGNAKRGR